MSHIHPDDHSDQGHLQEEDEDNRILTYAPEERFRLGRLDVMCLVINRMIGTGIFMTPGRVMQGTRSTGVSLFFWLAGIIYTLAGTHVYIEYGLNIPRYVFEGIEQGIPRSGGDLNYLQYVYRRPAYRKDTVLFSVCLFSIAFIALGNMAGNCINFAVRVLQSANAVPADGQPDNERVRGIAIAVATFTCFIHTFSRRGGILLNNVLAIIKVGILMLIIITTIIVAAGGLPKTPNVIAENINVKLSFSNSSPEAHGYADAFLAIIFAFSGFEQPNYVLGEIRNPKHRFPRSMSLAVSFVSVLYMAVNICYMVVVRKEDQIQHGNVAQQFFKSTFGRLSTGNNTGERVFYALLAISSFGNIVVMTYTAARVKQEIAKEGLLPWPKFFAQNYDFSLGRLLRWARGKRSLSMLQSLLKKRWLSPEQHSEKTPVGALLLHFVSSLVLIFATYGLTPDNAYNLLTGLISYVLVAFVGVFLGAGILILRLRSSHDWRNKSKPFNHTLSILAATVYLIGNLFPIITTWVPLSGSYKDLVSNQRDLPWFVLPLISWCVLVVGALWYLGFLGIAKRKASRAGLTFTVQKVPYFERDPPRTGPPFQDHETVYLAWVGEKDFVEPDFPVTDCSTRSRHDEKGIRFEDRAIDHNNVHPDFA